MNILQKELIIFLESQGKEVALNEWRNVLAKKFENQKDVGFDYFLNLIYPGYKKEFFKEIPDQDLEELQDFLKQAERPLIYEFYEHIQNEENFWCEEKASQPIQDYIEYILIDAEKLAKALNLVKKDGFAILVGGKRFYPKYLEDQQAFLQYLADNKNHFLRLFQDEGVMIELKFLLQEFYKKEKADSILQEWKSFKTKFSQNKEVGYEYFLLSLEPNLIERILPEVPHQSVKELQEYLKNVDRNQIVEFYQTITRPYNVWLNKKCSNEVREFINSSLQLVERFAEFRNISQEESFVIWFGGTRFYKSLDGRKINSEDNLIGYFTDCCINKKIQIPIYQDYELIEFQYLLKEFFSPLAGQKILNEWKQILDNYEKFEDDDYWNVDKENDDYVSAWWLLEEEKKKYDDD